MEINFDYLREILHWLSQALLTPVAITLVLMICIIVFIIGGVIVEIFIERIHFKPQMPILLDKLLAASLPEVPEVINDCGLLKRQKQSLITIYERREYPDDVLMALSDRLLKEQDDRFQRRVGRTDLLSKIAPMLGLMATLIPLGPGIVALGIGDTAELSTSLMVAFDATVTGLVVAVVSLAVSKLRKRWYANYMNAIKNACIALMRKLDDMAQAGADGAAVAAGAGGKAASTVSTSTENEAGSSTARLGAEAR